MFHWRICIFELLALYARQSNEHKQNLKKKLISVIYDGEVEIPTQTQDTLQ